MPRWRVEIVKHNIHHQPGLEFLTKDTKSYGFFVVFFQYLIYYYNSLLELTTLVKLLFLRVNM